MKANTLDGFLFNNGPGLFNQLEQPKVISYLERISNIEKQSQYQILKYWNRRWEYPFILSIIDEFIIQKEVLDAGSGQSLMPFLIQNESRHITALDIDDGSFYPKNSLDYWYQKMNKIHNSNISFVHGDLSRTNFRNEYFNFIYSISVLEHLSDPLSGLRELWRILKPGGIIAVTVDVSLDNSRGMFTKDYHAIRSFFSKNAIPIYPEVFTNTGGVITTDWFKRNDLEGLPWNLQRRSLKTRIRNLFSGRWNSLGCTYTYFASLFVAGLVYRKPE